MTAASESGVWYAMHMATGQIPMLHIRNTFRACGFDLAPGHSDRSDDWDHLAEIYTKSFQGALDQDRWRTFVKVAQGMGYGPAREDREAQGNQERHLREHLKEAPLVEARSRMANNGKWLRWQEVRFGGHAWPPKYSGDVGVDLAAAVTMVAEPNMVTYVPTGVAFAAPAGYWIMLVGRSSLAAKLGLAMVPGIIDHGYRGEMMAGVYPIGVDPITVDQGIRIAQAILMPVVTPVLEKVSQLPPSDRGHNGFGSTGGH